MAWEMYAPGLGGWTVHTDVEDDGKDMILVYPPLAYDEGYTLYCRAGEVVISWSQGLRRAASLRDALLLICPLPADALAAADRLATHPAIGS